MKMYTLFCKLDNNWPNVTLHSSIDSVISEMEIVFENPIFRDIFTESVKRNFHETPVGVDFVEFLLHNPSIETVGFLLTERGIFGNHAGIISLSVHESSDGKIFETIEP